MSPARSSELLELWRTRPLCTQVLLSQNTSPSTGKRQLSCAMSQAQEDDQSAQVSIPIPACTQTVCPVRDCVLNGRVNGVQANILVDTGAVTTVLSKSMWDCRRDQTAQLQTVTDRKLVGVQGAPLCMCVWSNPDTT